MEQEILTKKGEKTGRVTTLKPSIFGIEPNMHVLYLAVKSFLLGLRQGTHKAKERSELRGSTRKIQKQKGTGNARKGDIKSGILRGGGRIHGPRPHKYTLKLNKKTNLLARFSALSDKAKNNQILILEDFSFSAPKTREYNNFLENLSLATKKTLLILAESDKNLVLSARNIPKAEILMVNNLNTYAILNAQCLLFSETALHILQKQLS